MAQMNPVNMLKSSLNQSDRVDAKEIIDAGAKARGADANRAYAALSYLVQNNPEYRVFRSNNSLFIIQNFGNGQIEFDFETLDRPEKMVESVKDFFKAMQVAGFRTGTFDLSNQNLNKAIQQSGRKIKTRADNSSSQMGVVEF